MPYRRQLACVRSIGVEYQYSYQIPMLIYIPISIPMPIPIPLPMPIPIPIPIPRMWCSAERPPPPPIARTYPYVFVGVTRGTKRRLKELSTSGYSKSCWQIILKRSYVRSRSSQTANVKMLPPIQERCLFFLDKNRIKWYGTETIFTKTF